MMKTRIAKVVAAVAVVAIAGVAGATYASSRPTGDKPGSVGPAAINPNLSSELKFVPVTPCRILDTRETAAGKIAANSSRTFDVFGANLSGQGGSATGCGVPSYAASAALTVIATGPTGTGFIRGGAANLAVPSATILSYATGPNRSSSAPISLCRSGCPNLDEVKFAAFQHSTDLVVDVYGYFVEPVFATVEGDTTTVGAMTAFRSSGVDSITRTGVGTYVIDPSRDIRGCAILAIGGASDDGQSPNDDSNMTIETFSATDVRVYQTDAAGARVDDDWTFWAEC